jgi:endonuclease/exonuclease/phosphatase family metal-dependent hydrolase
MQFHVLRRFGPAAILAALTVLGAPPALAQSTLTLTDANALNKYFYDSRAVAVSQGTAVAFSGNTGETKRGRIDYIFYSRKSRGLSVKSSQVYDTRDANGVMLSDHRPVLTTFVVQ